MQKKNVFQNIKIIFNFKFCTNKAVLNSTRLIPFFPIFLTVFEKNRIFESIIEYFKFYTNFTKDGIAILEFWRKKNCVELCKKTCQKIEKKKLKI